MGYTDGISLNYLKPVTIITTSAIESDPLILVLKLEIDAKRREDVWLREKQLAVKTLETFMATTGAERDNAQSAIECLEELIEISVGEIAAVKQRLRSLRSELEVRRTLLGNI